MSKGLLIVFLAVMIMPFLTGCGNTLEGVGRDVERAGEKIQDAF
ncbi:MAG: entericidin A/B family lipoprotein [Rhodospirillales bacterium]|nr:entericidin A/B family lipoprotein [Rhodospirillales bacterium]